MVIAMIALLIGVGGTAIAADVSKRQVKKIAKTQAKKVFAQKAPGITFKLTTVNGPAVSVRPGDLAFPMADCPAGYTVVGTGIDAGNGHVVSLEKDGDVVVGGVQNNTSSATNASVQAICGQFPNSATSRLAPN